jgi:hypothetical protein
MEGGLSDAIWLITCVARGVNPWEFSRIASTFDKSGQLGVLGFPSIQFLGGALVAFVGSKGTIRQRDFLP